MPTSLAGRASRKLSLQDKTIPKRLIASNPRILCLNFIIDMIYVYYCHPQMCYFSTVRCCVLNTITVYCYCVLNTITVYCYCVLNTITVHCYCVLNTITVYCYCVLNTITVYCYCVLNTITVFCYCVLNTITVY